MMSEKPRFSVMLSSTFLDLGRHRETLRGVLQNHSIHPDIMEDDSSRSDQSAIEASLEKVDRVDGYLCIISKRYGHVHPSAKQNPQSLSLTELEFERAEARGIPIMVLIMGSDYPVGDSQNESDEDKRRKLEAFRKRAHDSECCTPTIFNDWEEFLRFAHPGVVNLAQAIERHAQGQAKTSAPAAGQLSPPAPPAFHLVRPFTQGHPFVGRRSELAQIGVWSRSNRDPLFIVEAMGGMGKSMLTHHWIDNHPGKWAGRLWYSFYESGANLNDFCVQALAYMEHKPPKDYAGLSASDLQTSLLRRLKEKPWLIAMDGLERILVQYNRHIEDKTAKPGGDGGNGSGERDMLGCANPSDDDLLRALATAQPSKLLISSRNMPVALLNNSGKPIPGVASVKLEGLEEDMAERMLRDAGVTGDSSKIRRYLKKHFGCHPLMVGQVAGLVLDYAPAHGNFDKWHQDAQAGGAVERNSNLMEKQAYLLKVAYGALDNSEKEVMRVLGSFPRGVDFATLVDLNPKRPKSPKPVAKPVPVEGDFELRWLRRQLERANTPEAKAEIEGDIARYTEMLQKKFAEDTEKYDAFVAELEAWRKSPELAEADRWLAGALKNLKRRALLIADQSGGDLTTYDLHPMVRTFVRGVILSDVAPSEISGAIVNYAQARLPTNYQAAQSIGDLAGGVEMVDALLLARRFDDAAELMSGDLGVAMGRLELHADRLEVLQAFFSRGFDQMPERVRDGWVQRSLAWDAAYSLQETKEHKRAEALLKRLIFSWLDRNFVRDPGRRLRNVAAVIRSYAILAADMNRLHLRSRLLELHKEIGVALADDAMLVRQCVSDIYLDITRGQPADARRKFEWLLTKTQSTGLYGEDSNVLGIRVDLLRADNALTNAYIDGALAQAVEWKVRHRERHLLYLKAELFQKQSRHADAVAIYDRIIKMSRESGTPANSAEALRAVSLVGMNKKSDAVKIADSLSVLRDPPHADLAKLRQKLGNKKLALHHAEIGFELAWGEGEPYTEHERLTMCREVLQAYRKRERSLPAFNPRKVESLEFEAELREQIALVVAQAKKKDDAPNEDAA